LAVASSARSLATAKFHDVETQVRKAQDELKDATTRWDSLINEVNNDLAIKRVAQEVLSKQFATAATSMQRSAAAQQLEVAFAGAQEAVKTAFAAYNLVDEDYKEFEAKHQELTAALEEEKKLSELMSDLVDAFGPRGVQAFVLQTAVDALQSSSQTYLNELSDGSIQLRLSIDAGDRISRAAFVRTPNGEFAERPLGSLSGGQWRRCSMALSLGFADLVATRGRMRPSLCVFDEPLTFLDTSGRVAVGKLLRSLLRRQQGGVESTKLSLSTVLVILQDLAAEELEEAFDRIDEVVKEGGTTTVNVDEIEK
jgi:DNA repair exonuclease SbcCD ATPase subunit